YRYIPNQRRRLDTNMFETRLLGGQKTVCLSGEDGASLFYDNDKFRRVDAMPKRVLKTLFGQGGVQTLDDDAHKNRKELFMSLMGSERLSDFAHIFKKRWEDRKSTRLNSSHVSISYAVFCLKKISDVT